MVAALFAAVAALVASAHLTWVSAGAGPASASYSLTHAPLAFAAVCLIATLVAVGALGAAAGRVGGLDLAAAAATALALLVGGFICVAEVAATLVPDDVLPDPLRRFALDSGAGTGAWLALIASTAVVVLGAAPVRRHARGLTGALLCGGFMRPMALCVVIGGGVALVQLRQEPWLEASGLGGAFSLDAASLPWVAPATFGAVWLIVVSVALAALRRWELAALSAAGAGWLANAAAATTVAGAHLLVGVNVRVVEPTLGTWVTFALGLGIAGAAALLLREGTVRS